MMKLKNTVVLLLLILLPLAAAAETEEDPMLSGVVLNVSYDGSVVVKVALRAEFFLLYGIQFPDTQDDAWQDARRLCRKMVMNKSGRKWGLGNGDALCIFTFEYKALMVGGDFGDVPLICSFSKNYKTLLTSVKI